MRVVSNKKIREIYRQFEKNNIDAAVFVNKEPIIDMNIPYLTGFFGMLNGVLIFSNNSTLITSTLDYNRALKEAEANKIINKNKYRIDKLLIKNLKGFKRVGVVKDIFPLSLAEKLKRKLKLEFVDLGKFMLELRASKENKELKLIKKSASIANYCIEIIKDILNTKKSLKEKELAAEIEYEINLHDAEVAFKTIVTSGAKSAYIHPCTSNELIEKGLGLIDFGVIYKGYVTDVTVPFTIGSLGSTQERMVKTVERMYYKLIGMTKPDVKVCEVCEVAKNIASKAKFELRHSLGHGIGLEVHEFPSISEKEKIKLKEGMVLAIEPGVYVNKFGGCRLENDVLITKSGCKVLTNSKLIKI